MGRTSNSGKPHTDLQHIATTIEFSLGVRTVDIPRLVGWHIHRIDAGYIGEESRLLWSYATMLSTANRTGVWYGSIADGDAD
jgi:hypothetical protein